MLFPEEAEADAAPLELALLVREAVDDKAAEVDPADEVEVVAVADAVDCLDESG